MRPTTQEKRAVVRGGGERGQELNESHMQAKSRPVIGGDERGQELDEESHWQVKSRPVIGGGGRGQELDEEGHWQAKSRPGIIIVKSGKVVATQLRPNISPVLITRNSS